MAAGAQAQPQQQGGGQDQGGGDPMDKFRQLAQAAMAIGKEFPEAAEEMTAVVKALQGAMTKVSANPQRGAPQKAPPQG
jgi:hypothetical protein